MNSNSTSLIIALGTSLSVATNALASSPGTLFQVKPLANGYQNTPTPMKLASDSADQSNPSPPETDNTEKTPQGKCGAGKCSSNKKGMGKCGTGKCGTNQPNEEEDSTNETTSTDSKE